MIFESGKVWVACLISTRILKIWIVSFLDWRKYRPAMGNTLKQPVFGNKAWNSGTERWTQNYASFEDFSCEFLIFYIQFSDISCRKQHCQPMGCTYEQVRSIQNTQQQTELAMHAFHAKTSTHLKCLELFTNRLKCALLLICSDTN